MQFKLTNTDDYLNILVDTIGNIYLVNQDKTRGYLLSIGGKHNHTLELIPTIELPMKRKIFTKDDTKTNSDDSEEKEELILASTCIKNSPFFAENDYLYDLINEWTFIGDKFNVYENVLPYESLYDSYFWTMNLTNENNNMENHNDGDICDLQSLHPNGSSLYSLEVFGNVGLIHLCIQNENPKRYILVIDEDSCSIKFEFAGEIEMGFNNEEELNGVEGVVEDENAIDEEQLENEIDELEKYYHNLTS